MERNLHEQISIHDKFQFELKYTYPFDRTRKELEYLVETYIFIPNNLGVNQESYGKRQFYNDIQKYIRFKTPVFQLSSINKPEGPVARLKATMEAIAATGADRGDYEYRLKMLCSILKSALRDEGEHIEQRKTSQESITAAREYIEHVIKILSEFRSLRPLLNSPQFQPSHTAFYNFADEYISLLVEKSLFILIEYFKDGNATGQDELCFAALNVIKSEIAYRTSRNYPSIARDNNSNEEVIYRMRTLKKIMGSILLLKTQTQLEGRWFEQLLMGMAAGLSMAFATGMVFISRRVFADLTLSIFIILVVSYIFKDRIKDLSKIYLLEYAKHFFYDYKTILMTNLTKIGFCRETFLFLKENNLPPEIVKIRNKNYFSELENGFLGENVISYKKYIKIFTGSCPALLADFQVDGLNDIVRFNIRHYLDKMDDAEKLLPVPDGDNSYQMVKGNNVYQLNMVLKYSHAGEEEYRKFRIFLDRNGIKRLTELPCPVN